MLVQTTRRNVVWLCECQKGFLKYPATHGDLDTAATVWIRRGIIDVNNITFVDADAPDADAINKGTPSVVKSVSDQCYRTVPLDPGNHLITVEQKGLLHVNLGYVVHW